MPTTETIRPSPIWSLCAASLVFVAASPVWGDDAKLPAEQEPPPVSPMREKIRVMMDRSHEHLVVTTHPDGRESVRVGSRCTHMLAAVRNPDGSLQIRCFHDAEALERFKAEALAEIRLSRPAPIPTEAVTY